MSYKCVEQCKTVKNQNNILQFSKWLPHLVHTSRSINRASTISDEDHRMKLNENDFIIVQQKTDRIDQKLSDLYRNWQAEYRNAVTHEDVDEVKKLHKPFLDKYESKYRIHYQMLQQMTRQADLADMPSTHEQTSNFTHSLVALDDAQALMKKEWNGNEPGEEIPREYSTPRGHLTSTQPRQGYMRVDSTLHIIPEGSQNEYNIMTTLRGDVDPTESQQTLKTSEQITTLLQLHWIELQRHLTLP